jgi:hypothetical protein
MAKQNPGDVLTEIRRANPDADEEEILERFMEVMMRRPNLKQQVVEHFVTDHRRAVSRDEPDFTEAVFERERKH